MTFVAPAPNSGAATGGTGMGCDCVSPTNTLVSCFPISQAQARTLDTTAIQVVLAPPAGWVNIPTGVSRFLWNGAAGCPNPQLWVPIFGWRALDIGMAMNSAGGILFGPGLIMSLSGGDRQELAIPTAAGLGLFFWLGQGGTPSGGPLSALLGTGQLCIEYVQMPIPPTA